MEKLIQHIYTENPTHSDANLPAFRILSFGQVWAKGEFNVDWGTRKSYFMDTSGLSRLYFNILTGHFIFPQPRRSQYSKAITRFISFQVLGIV